MFKQLKPFKGPKRYVFKDPDTGFHFEAPSRKVLIAHIISYRAQNGLEPIQEMTRVLENYWCTLQENINAGVCEECPPLNRGILAYIKGGVVLLSNVFMGDRNMVDDATAEARAKQCVKCPYNRFPKKAAFEGQADLLAEHMTGGRKTSLHSELGNCRVCTCNLRAKVFQKGPFSMLSDREKVRMKRVNCWQTEE